MSLAVRTRRGCRGRRSTERTRPCLGRDAGPVGAAGLAVRAHLPSSHETAEPTRSEPPGDQMPERQLGGGGRQGDGQGDVECLDRGGLHQRRVGPRTRSIPRTAASRVTAGGRCNARRAGRGQAIQPPDHLHALPDADQRNLDAFRRIAQAPNSGPCQQIRLRDPLTLSRQVDMSCCFSRNVVLTCENSSWQPWAALLRGAPIGVLTEFPTSRGLAPWALLRTFAAGFVDWLLLGVRWSPRSASSVAGVVPWLARER